MSHIQFESFVLYIPFYIFIYNRYRLLDRLHGQLAVRFLRHEILLVVGLRHSYLQHVLVIHIVQRAGYVLRAFHRPRDQGKDDGRNPRNSRRGQRFHTNNDARQHSTGHQRKILETKYTSSTKLLVNIVLTPPSHLVLYMIVLLNQYRSL